MHDEFLIDIRPPLSWFLSLRVTLQFSQWYFHSVFYWKLLFIVEISSDFWLYQMWICARDFPQETV